MAFVIPAGPESAIMQDVRRMKVDPRFRRDTLKTLELCPELKAKVERMLEDMPDAHP